jgi:hypothetical protein
MSLPIYKRVTIPLIIAIILAAFTLINYFYPFVIGDWSSHQFYTGPLSDLTISLGAIMAWFGLINMVRLWTREVRRKIPGRWYFAIYALIGCFVMIGFGVLQGWPNPGWTANPTVAWIYRYFLQWCITATVSMTGFWTIRITYRTFRAKGWPSTLYLASAAIGIIKNAPIGGYLLAGSIPVGYWLMTVPYIGVSKGVLFGIGAGSIAYVVRFLLGRERSALARGGGAQ